MSESTSRHLGQKFWDCLPKEQQEVMKKLGFTPVPDEKAVPRGKLKEAKKDLVCKRPAYFLGLNCYCTLCRQTSVTIYKMIPQEKGDIPYLASAVPADETVDKKKLKWESRRLYTCHKCEKELPKLPKKELVELLLKYASQVGTRNTDLKNFLEDRRKKGEPTCAQNSSTSTGSKK